jgi:hypothetical protein
MSVLYEFRDDKGLTLQLCDKRKGRPIPRVGDSCLCWRGRTIYTLQVDKVMWDLNVGAYDVIVSGTITEVRGAKHNDINSDSRLYPVRDMILNLILFGTPLIVSGVLSYLGYHYYLRTLAPVIGFPVGLVGFLLCYCATFFFTANKPFEVLSDWMIPRPSRESDGPAD